MAQKEDILAWIMRDSPYVDDEEQEGSEQEGTQTVEGEEQQEQQEGTTTAIITTTAVEEEEEEQQDTTSTITTVEEEGATTLVLCQHFNQDEASKLIEQMETTSINLKLNNWLITRELIKINPLIEYDKVSNLTLYDCTFQTTKPAKEITMDAKQAKLQKITIEYVEYEWAPDNVDNLSDFLVGIGLVEEEEEEEEDEEDEEQEAPTTRKRRRCDISFVVKIVLESKKRFFLVNEEGHVREDISQNQYKSLKEDIQCSGDDGMIIEVSLNSLERIDFLDGSRTFHLNI